MHPRSARQFLLAGLNGMAAHYVRAPIPNPQSFRGYSQSITNQDWLTTDSPFGNWSYKPGEAIGKSASKGRKRKRGQPPGGPAAPAGQDDLPPLVSDDEDVDMDTGVTGLGTYHAPVRAEDWTDSFDFSHEAFHGQDVQQGDDMSLTGLIRDVQQGDDMSLTGGIVRDEDEDWVAALAEEFSQTPPRLAKSHKKRGQEAVGDFLDAAVGGPIQHHHQRKGSKGKEKVYDYDPDDGGVGPAPVPAQPVGARKDNRRRRKLENRAAHFRYASSIRQDELVKKRAEDLIRATPAPQPPGRRAPASAPGRPAKRQKKAPAVLTPKKLKKRGKELDSVERQLRKSGVPLPPDLVAVRKEYESLRLLAKANKTKKREGKLQARALTPRSLPGGDKGHGKRVGKKGKGVHRKADRVDSPYKAPRLGTPRHLLPLPRRPPPNLQLYYPSPAAVAELTEQRRKQASTPAFRPLPPIPLGKPAPRTPLKGGGAKKRARIAHAKKKVRESPKGKKD